jgi:D-glycero-D-manno-heptose 1,7-bisphosphate phosphatase
MDTSIYTCKDTLSSPKIKTGLENRAVFFDRDGTIIEEKPYLRRVSDLVLLPDTVDCLKKLDHSGLLLFLYTNQAGIAHGYFSEKTLEEIHTELCGKLRKQGIILRGILFCPHHPAAELKRYRRDCFGRKPHPGLLYKAAAAERLDLTRSYVIGDKLTDLQAGNSAGTKTGLVLTGHGITECTKLTSDSRPDFIGANLTQVTKWVLDDLNKGADAVENRF